MKRVLVTRPAEQADELRHLLDARGIDAVTVPTVAIEPVGVGEDLDRALDRLQAETDGAAGSWLVLTSANGARAVVERLERGAVRIPSSVRVAAVGPATAAVLEGAGVDVHHVPQEFLTVAIADGMGDVAQRRVVLARADRASPALPDVLRARGAAVEEVVAYRTVEGPPASRAALQRALHTGLDGVTFTSGSTVRGMVALLTTMERRAATLLPAFCIGPVTANAARLAGFDPAVVAAEHTAAALADAIADYFDGGERWV